MPTSPFLAALRSRVLVLDGAMGTAIYEYDLDLEKDYLNCENCTDVLVKTRPDVIQAIHESYLKVGADCVETDSFGANQLVLAEFGLEAETYHLARQSAEVARAACDIHSTSDKPRFVLGSMGPGTKLITLGQTDWDTLKASYAEQVRGLIDGGADAMLIETCQDLLQVKCAINAVLQVLDEKGKSPDEVPIMVSVTIEQQGTMLAGSSIDAAIHALKGYPIASLGLNCATGPTEMGEHIAQLSKHWDRTISVYPNAGLPVLVEGRTEYPLSPDPMAEAVQKFVEADGVGLIGGCCGTTPEHIAKLAEVAEGRAPKARTLEPYRASSTSLYAPVEHRQDNSFLIVGERCNASGSRKFKQLLEEEDWDGMIALARGQVREGSHVLDINVDYAGRDNVRDMAEFVKRLVRQVDAPLMIDSTQIATLDAGLRHAAGKCLINSANFEDGEEKFDEICALASEYGAGLVIGTIDEDPEAAMARTRERKLAIAERAIERATTEHGIDVRDIFIDPLVLPVSTGMEEDKRSGLETIEGTRLISEKFPDVQTTVGLSNISFGLKPVARHVLNSVFLYELVEAGLTSAIVHSSKIMPLAKMEEEHIAAAKRVLYADDAQGAPLQAFIELFKDVQSVQEDKPKLDELPIEERLRTHIIDGEKENLDKALETAMQTYAPLAIINDHLLDGMKTVGELFGSGQMQLPFVLQSAEVMKRAVAHLEPHLDRVDGETKGSIVLATVKGDVHDIGKNLVDIILTNNGYTVHNIGIKQPISDILKAFEETKADAIGLSGLLVKSVNVMEDNLREMNTQGLSVPVILGGAALTRHYCEGHLASVYEGDLFYGKDAFEGLATMDAIVSGETKTIFDERAERIAKRTAAEETVAKGRAEQGRKQDEFEANKASSGGTLTAERVRSDVATDTPVPGAPFFGSRIIEGVKPDELYPFINLVALYRGQWQMKKGKMTDEQYAHHMEDHADPVLARLKERSRAEDILDPKLVYGYWPCNSDGDDVIIYHPEEHDREIERFTFPRQEGKKRLCLADFFRSVDSGERDVIGFSCVTVGEKVSEVANELFKNNDYTEYLYMHGFGVECAEALAELWHKRMRAELGIGNDDSPKIKELFRQAYRGSRYSPGYPACPDMSDQDIVWRLLEPERIGCRLTENWQIDPEQSTSAIVVHHPEAKYFNV